MAYDLDERLAIGTAVRQAIACLPVGWSIEIIIERDRASACLFPKRFAIPPETDRRTLPEQIRDGLDFAVSHELPP